MAALGQPPKAQFFNGNGFPLVGGRVYTETGINNSPVVTFTDPTKTANNPNPVILNGRGETGLWSDAASYRIRVYDVDDTLVYSSENYPPPPPAKATFYDSAGRPLAGGRVYTYEAGTSTFLATYVNALGLTENLNPVILDERGQADIWFGPSKYKIILKTAADVEIYTVDNYGV